MTAEASIREAIVEELKRQAANSRDGGPSLSVEANETQVTIHGPVDLDDLVMVILGSVAGGP